MPPRELASAALRAFVRANRTLARGIAARLAPDSNAFYHHYDEVVVEHLVRAPAGVVADVGGGRSCSYARLLPKGRRLVAVDVDEQELAHNHDVDERRLADIVRGLPFDDEEVGVITSRAVLEHVADVEAFVAESARVLAPGGWAIHLLPGRRAVFALVARRMPFDLAKRALHLLRPETQGVVEFPVHYDRGTASELEATFRRGGFGDVRIEPCYSSAGYFDWFLPLYLAMLAYEALLRRLDARDFAAYYLVVARRDALTSTAAPTGAAERRSRFRRAARRFRRRPAVLGARD